MKRPRQRRAKIGKQPGSVTLRRRDKLLIAGMILGILTVIFAFEHFYWTRKAATALEARLGQWKRRHHLTDDQVNRLRTIEFDYHGSGDPFLVPAHNLADESAHSRLLREVMRLEAQPALEAPPLESP